jgi:preprotein translocase subunit SecA
MQLQHAEAQSITGGGGGFGGGTGGGAGGQAAAGAGPLARAMGGGQAAQGPAPEPFVREEKKVGRNEPCPCGSGKKYKHCHGKLS